VLCQLLAAVVPSRPHLLKTTMMAYLDNAAEGHYIGLRSPSIPPVTNVDSVGQCMGLRSTTASARASLAHRPMLLGSISSVVQQDEDVESMSMSISSLSGITVDEADDAMDDDADDVFSSNVGSRVLMYARPDTNMSVSGDACSGGHDRQQDSQIKCVNSVNCRRSETDKCPLRLKSYTGKFILDILVSFQQTVWCMCCASYVTLTLQPSKLWCRGWPSVIVCLLILRKFRHLHTEVWNMFIDSAEEFM